MINYKNIILQKTNIKPKTVLEIGSRDGDDAEILRGSFNVNPKKVWVVEPNPIQHDSIIKKYPDVNLIKSPIFNEVKNLTFYGVDVDDQILNGVSSVLDRIDGLYDKLNTNKIEIQTILGSNLLDLIGEEIDLCKIDVEGATYEVLDSFGEKINKIKSMHIECEHKQVWVNQKLYEEVEKFLITNGFEQIYFKYCNNDVLQSDSIWVQSKYIL